MPSAEEDGNASPAPVLRRIENAMLDVLERGYVEVDGGARRVDLTSPALRNAVHVLAVAHDLLSEGRTATLREVYYRGRKRARDAEEGYANEADAARAVELAARVCGVDRAALGLFAASKGWFCGALEWRASRAEPWRSPRRPPPRAARFDAVAVPEDLDEWEARPLQNEPHLRARFVLVVEKYTVFYRIVNSEFLSRVPCVVVTGRGFPDLATRKLLRRVVDGLGRGTDAAVPVLGVCDFNPHGLMLMSAYACGSDASRESDAYACRTLRVVGLLADDVDRMALERRDVETFSAADRAAVASLVASPRVRAWDPRIADEARRMAERGFKVDLDTLARFGADFLVREWLPRTVVRA